MTLSTFTIFFWTLAGIILLMLINEEKLLELEARYDEWKENKKKYKAHGKTNKDI